METSPDGAHLGVDANRALETILGDAPQPSDEERITPEQMRAKLLAAPGEPFGVDESGAATDDGYAAASNYTGRLILEQFLADPPLASAPIELVYDWDADPDRGAHGLKPEFIIDPGLSSRLKERGVVLPVGLSGFMWARRGMRWIFRRCRTRRSSTSDRKRCPPL